jgi:hypothetical protein
VKSIDQNGVGKISVTLRASSSIWWFEPNPRIPYRPKGSNAPEKKGLTHGRIRLYHPS